MENKKTTIEALLDKGKANGRLTTKEITDALEELDLTSIRSTPFMTTAKASTLRSLRT